MFGARRLKACKELNLRKISAVVLDVKEEKIKRISFEQRFQRKLYRISDISESALGLSEKCELPFDGKTSEKIKNYILLSDEAKKYADDFEGIINLSKGNSDNFMAGVKSAIKGIEGKKIRLSFYNDRRIFINEIQHIIALMNKEGFSDYVSENENEIIIKKIS